MKARINLYHNEFRPQFEWITAPHLIVLTALAFMLCGGVYSGLYYWQQQTQLMADNLNSSIRMQQRNIDEFTRALQTRQGDPVLAGRLNDLQRERSSQDKLLVKVKDMAKLKQKSFSTLFDALASSNSNSLWLTEFTVNEADLTIKGSLSKPSALTQWINDLSKTTFFKGQEFDDAKVLREDGQLTFELSSVVTEQTLLVSQGGENGAN
ncbi:PilN domain-containing protein [Glaciecola sp. XM2]|jgi:Tfp pilus assembly protein PilN|uniref:PilN domain-containing protein n=1 Tax=Glaciecola sp. XM2 TaxID=1914931 RepID=UPI001BDE7560|nr:PilN domain-containing protein [Glaciecola sp. XM2]MBT1451696.1 PilN domain-containing protein [Glaciecola sp. XM2]